MQDFDPAVQRAVNREQSVEQTLQAIDDCRSSAFRSVNIDLIYGLPQANRRRFHVHARYRAFGRPDRVSIYGYAHLPEVFKAQRQIATVDMPDAATRLALFQLAIDRLTAAGYRHIGMDHFALPDDDLANAQLSGSLHRNFMGYTTHASCDLIGFGMSAISHVGDSFSQNARELHTWEMSVDQGRVPVWRGMELSFDDQVRAEVIQQLMCQAEVDIPAIEHRYEIDFDVYFAAALRRLEPLAADGLVSVDARRITATSRGRLLLRIIAMCFDRYLTEDSPADTRPRYSRVI